MILMPEQQAAVDGALAFLAQPSVHKPYFSIQGLAGTGKTTLLAQLGAKVPNATIVAPTGKAAAVLRNKCGLPVKTIHSAIYDFTGLVEDDTDPLKRLRPTFQDKQFTGLTGRAVLLDECSMVGEKLASDLLETGAVVVACGDPGQLPPVKDRQYFSDADIVLQQIHRQALESPIIRQAHAIRNGKTYQSDGDGFQVLTSSRDVDLRRFDMVLCWTNKTRKGLNTAIRSAHDRRGKCLFPGEPVMCLRNDYKFQMFNGEVYIITQPREPGGILCLDNGKELSGAAIEGFDADYDEALKDDDRTPFALAYAVTAHKAQGSEFPRVAVFDEMPASQAERPRWLYTAITRASQHCTVIRPAGW